MKKTYRKCDTCKNEYRVTREAQSYCSPRCRRKAAYGRERFENETNGPRKRRSRSFRLLPYREASKMGIFPQQNQYAAKPPTTGFMPIIWRWRRR